jgi:hypothetical protein
MDGNDGVQLLGFQNHGRQGVAGVKIERVTLACIIR